jgi:hypothetical protein
MRYHIEGDTDAGTQCGSPGETHEVAEPLDEDDYWCSMCARIWSK